MRGWNDDPFTKKARAHDYAARSAFKLEEIDRREGVLKSARRVLDLGAAPGSWSQYVLRKHPRAEVIAVDLKEPEFSHPQLKFLQGSIDDVDWTSLLGDEKMDVVLSDMAPATSGQAERDVALSLELAETAHRVASDWLKPGGHFVVKLFMGQGFEEFRASLRDTFERVSLLRPQSTRKQSREIFLIGKKRRG